MIQESPQAVLESISALKRAVKGNRDLTIQKTEKNIVNNLVLVAKFKRIDSVSYTHHPPLINMRCEAIGTGLQLTTDGFVSVPYYIISSFEDDWRKINKKSPSKLNIYHLMKDMERKYAVIDQQLRTYPIDSTFLSAVPGWDIALIKAVMLKKPEPINFRVATKDLKVGDEIKSLSFWDQRRLTQYGSVISTGYDIQVKHPVTGKPLTIQDTFLTDVNGADGTIGGVFLGNGEFVGPGSIRGNGYACGVKVSNFQRFIEDVVSTLESSLNQP